MAKKVALHNLGCKVNAYETEAMQQMLEAAGYEIVPFAPGADIYIINTCTVTNIADRKSRQMLHRAKKMNPEAIVAAMGCYVQADRKKAEQDPSIDLLIGNNRKKDLLTILEQYQAEQENRQEDSQANSQADNPKNSPAAGSGNNQGNSQAAGRGNNQENSQAAGKGNNQENSPAASLENGRRDSQEKRQEVADISREKEYEELRIDRTEEHTRAYLKVQDGCNQFCTYCIIPYARGRVRSRKTEEVVEEVRRLARSGCQEIVLTGIHLSSYGVDRKADGETLLSLIQAVHSVDGISRIRLGSLEPGIVTEEFAAELAKLPKICPHFHLSLQSGCTATLQRMNRRYTAEEYRIRCGILRKYFPKVALTTDVIAGFPQETEEEFAQSYAFIDEIGFYETHIFPYSRREGTKAANMDGQLSEQVKKERSRKLIELGKRNRLSYMRQFLGTEKEVLFEERQEIGGDVFWVGHTKEYLKVALASEEFLANQRVTVKLDHIGPEDHLVGKFSKWSQNTH